MTVATTTPAPRKARTTKPATSTRRGRTAVATTTTVSFAHRTVSKKPLTESEARLLTNQIRQTAAGMWLMISEAHERGAWKAMGYSTWKAYVTEELQMSEQRSFQILDTAKVMKELEAAGALVDDINPPPARVVALVRNDLPAVRRAARAAIKKGNDPVEAVRDLSKAQAKSRAEAQAQAQPAVPAAQDTVQGELVEDVACPACSGHGKLPAARATEIQALLNA